jgi:hypothetical protein
MTGHRTRTLTAQELAPAIVAKALREGRLVRPAACSKCGTTRRMIQGHHPDYDKPLEVVWLCTRCHHLVHANSRGGVINVRLTVSEKTDLRLVSAFDMETESDTLREHTIAQIRGRAERIRSSVAA